MGLQTDWIIVKDCIMPIDENTQYDKVCRGEFKSIHQRLDKLFVDNGSESFQSKLNRHDQFVKRFSTMMYIIVVPIVAVGINSVHELIVVVIAMIK